MEKHVKLYRHLVIGLVMLGMLSTLEAEATVFLSDHFDNQATATLGNDPPSPWGRYGFFSDAMEITPSASHNPNGKGFRINWNTGQKEQALCSPEGAVSSWGNEVYIGYWHRHKAPWVNNSSAAHKWLHFFVGGESAMWNYDHGQGLVLFFDGLTRFTANLSWDDGDGGWHSYVFRMRLGTGTSGKIQVWRDGQELNITPHSQAPSGPASGFDWGGSSFQNRMCFGFQHHAGLGAGMWEDWDDIIIANTQQEVLNFLGGVKTSPGGDSTPPAAPTGLKLQVN